jgi:hypothetical protein
MDRILGALKATYNFFSGDAIVLTAVALAFVVAYLLEVLNPRNQWAPGILFVVLILLGITVTLGRERASTRRKQSVEHHTS